MIHLVPKFPLVNYSSLHGEVEWEHYPKPGDPNPIVKMGIAHININKVVWIDEDETARSIYSVAFLDS